MSSRCSRLDISALNSPALLCLFAWFALSGAAAVCRVRLWVLWLSFALFCCQFGVFASEISRRPSQAVLLCSELWFLLFREGAHRATPYFILAPFSAAAAAFFVSGSRPRLPFRFPVLRSFFVAFFAFAPCQALLKKNPHFGDFFSKGLDKLSLVWYIDINPSRLSAR